MDHTPLPITRIFSRPAIGILFSLWTYGCGLWVASAAARILAPGTREFIVVSVPFLTLLLAVGIIYFVYRASDEYIRHRILKCAALTGVVMAFSTLGYFCLEMLGYARLSMIVVNLYGWVIFTVLMLWILYRAR